MHKQIDRQVKTYLPSTVATRPAAMPESMWRPGPSGTPAFVNAVLERSYEMISLVLIMLFRSMLGT